MVKKTYFLGLALLVFLLGIQLERPQGSVLSGSAQENGDTLCTDLPLFEEDFVPDERLDLFTPTTTLLFPYLAHFSSQPRSQFGLYILKHSYLI